MLTTILTIIAVTSVAALIRWARDLLRPAGILGLSLFRPYRGDPWPRGVQEDYEVHFDWSPHKAPAPPIEPTWTDIVVEPAAGETTAAAIADDIEIEDLYRESAAIEHVDGHVHRGAVH